MYLTIGSGPHLAPGEDWPAFTRRILEGEPHVIANDDPARYVALGQFVERLAIVNGTHAHLFDTGNRFAEATKPRLDEEKLDAFNRGVIMEEIIVTALEAFAEAGVE